MTNCGINLVVPGARNNSQALNYQLPVSRRSQIAFPLRGEDRSRDSTQTRGDTMPLNGNLLILLIQTASLGCLSAPCKLKPLMERFTDSIRLSLALFVASWPGIKPAISWSREPTCTCTALMQWSVSGRNRRGSLVRERNHIIAGCYQQAPPIRVAARRC